jgi:predicted nucleotidyltransferase component of viral defense system
MLSPAFELREFFHLTFLRHFSARLTGRAYAVKGGIGLRFFHASPRLSEDMDLDVSRGVGVGALRKTVDTVLENQAFLGHLAGRGVSGLAVSAPKQTTTTQRWKISLHIPGGSLHTKLEFSRRADDIPHETGVPHPEILSRHKSMPFAAQFYGASLLMEQKIRALAAPNRNAVRDLFDLHHLIFTRRAEGQVTATEVVESAIEKIDVFSFADFVEQVRPYLTEELVAAYREKASFDRIKEETSSALLEQVS